MPLTNLIRGYNAVSGIRARVRGVVVGGWSQNIETATLQMTAEERRATE